MTKFKVGDRVKIIDLINGSPEKYLNKIGTVNNVIHKFIEVRFNEKINGNYCWCFEEKELELIKQKQFTKSDLKDRYVVKTRKGYEYIVDLKGDKILRLDNGVQLDTYLYLKSYNNDLTYSNFICYCFDIIEIYKPEYKTIWTRPEEVKPEPKELTVDEISKLLGYDIKIIGGEK